MSGLGDHDGYAGPATLLIEGTEVDVHVDLRGYFEPIDGYYHWYGRIAADERVTALADSGKRAAEIRTPEGTAGGELSDPDPWDRYRITGTSTPPFTVVSAEAS